MPPRADELSQLFGVDPDDPQHQLGVELAEADQDLIAALIAMRQKRHLKQKDIAALIKRDPATVSTFERLGADPRLSTVRRYARAVGARVIHHVEDARPAGYTLTVTYAETNGGLTPEPGQAGDTRTMQLSA